MQAMRNVTTDKLEWAAEEGCQKATVHSEKLGDTQVQLQMLEVGAGQTLKPHSHKKRREFLCVVHSSGAQIRLGERVFRPTAGQTFEREPGEVMEIINDTHLPTRILVTQIGFDSSDVQWA